MKSLSALLLASILSALASDLARAVEVYRGRCHMLVCAFFAIQEKSIVAAHRDGALFRVSYLGFTTRRPTDRPPARKDWTRSDGYVHCSKTRPATIFNSDGDWIGHVLAPASPSGLSGYNLTSYVRYFAVCHALGVAALDEEILAAGKRLGYGEALRAEQVTLANPEDILKP
jgi:hypothetical protein